MSSGITSNFNMILPSYVYPLTVKDVTLDDIALSKDFGSRLYEITATIMSVDPNVTEATKQCLEGHKCALRVFIDPEKLPKRGNVFLKDDRLKPVTFESVKIENHADGVFYGKITGMTLRDVSVEIDPSRTYMQGMNTIIRGKIFYVNDRFNDAACQLTVGMEISIETTLLPNQTKPVHTFARLFVDYPAYTGGIFTARETLAETLRSTTYRKPMGILEITREIAESDFRVPPSHERKKDIKKKLVPG